MITNFEANYELFRITDKLITVLLPLKVKLSKKIA